jgi:hypothetical protein
MSLPRLRPLLLPLLLLASNAAFAAPFKVCPAIGKVRQIYICVGNPKDLVYLAPDDDSDNYSLGYYYDHGEFITIRCEYTDGQARDVELRERVEICRGADSKRYGQQLICQ